MKDDLNFNFNEHFDQSGKTDACDCDWCAVIHPLYEIVKSEIDRFKKENKITETEHSNLILGISTLKTQHNFLFLDVEELKYQLEGKLKQGNN